MRPHLRTARPLLLAVLLMVVAGCGAEGKVESNPKPEQLEGATLASRANTQLEKQNPQMTHGQLTCGDVKYKVGATSRCLRTVVLADGRLVRIGATVTIDSTKGSGHFEVKVDDTAQEFGITGKAVLDDLSKQYAARFKTKVPTGTCPPYLPGKVGAKITCVLNVAEGKLAVVVKVTRVEPKTFGTEYTFRARP
jgi:hypothetical protein